MNKLELLRRLQATHCENLTSKFRSTCGAIAMPSGSIVSGHYDGTKARTYSFNQNCPYERVTEIDVRILLPKSMKLDTQTSTEITESCRVEYVSEIIDGERFGRIMSLQYAFRYEEHDKLGPLEWEYTINTAPFFEFSRAFPVVFSHEELSWQTRIRNAVRTSGGGLITEYNPIKQIHARECIWRCVALLALDKLGIQRSEATFVKSLPGVDALAALTSSWIDGKWGATGLDHEAASFPDYMLDNMGANVSNLRSLPKQPGWVKQALDVQAERRLLCLRTEKTML